MKPFRPQVLVAICMLGLIGTMLAVVEVFTERDLGHAGWAALGSVIAMLGMLGSRLIEKDD